MIRNIYGVAVDTMSLDAGGGLERKWVAHTTFLGSTAIDIPDHDQRRVAAILPL